MWSPRSNDRRVNRRRPHLDVRHLTVAERHYKRFTFCSSTLDRAVTTCCYLTQSEIAQSSAILNNMSSNRPFLANFFAAFRAHSVIQKTAATPSSAASAASQASYYHTSASNTSQQSNNTSSNPPSNPRTINPKSGAPVTGPTSAAVQVAGQFQTTRHHAPSPYSRSPGSPHSPGFPVNGAQSRGRRGSDSSSDGFRETLGAEKWYIGGRTATGEEKFYRLGMVKRPQSLDRLSLDRLSI